MLLSGCVVDHLPEPDDAGAPRFVELKLKAPLPRVGTLRRRGATPDTIVLALRAPAECITSSAGPLALTPELERNLTWLDHATEALGATLVVLPTPIEITPGARSRDLLRAYAERLPRRDERVWVWSPRGPWEPEPAYALAESLGLVCAFEPLHAPRPDGPIAYAQLHGLGVESRLSTPALERVLDATAPERGTVYVAVDGPHAKRHATLLQQLADARA